MRASAGWFRGWAETPYSELPILLIKLDKTCRMLKYYCVIKEQFRIELFCEQRDCARPTGTALCGIYRGPGRSRRACRSSCSSEELLHRSVVARGAEKRRAHGRAACSGQRPTDAPVTASSGRRRALE